MPHADDLCTLEVLDEDTILETLRHRYEKERFYTYIGDILVSFNPCKPLKLFSDKHHASYRNIVSSRSAPPHLFWVAGQAYRSMLETGQNQCILVSGESGAGKTECTKYIIRHLMHVSSSEDRHLLDKIVKVNPLLEAFGNAATVMNNNSSRFGKFIELHYRDDGILLGAKIDDYILEKSRVVHRTSGEKNFHIFYALFAGMSRDRLLYYFLEDPDSHRIMKDSNPSRGVYESPEEFQYYQKMFTQLTCLMYQIGFSEEHLTLIYILLASILHLANIVFLPCEDTDGVTIADEYPLTAVAKLLGIEDEVALTEALISNVSYIKGERIQSWKSAREAKDGRDALTKELYARLFGWIVGQVNRNLWPSRLGDLKMARGPSVGLLDMSGFENFETNGFDQFLINISNERLQQYFMDYIFPREKKEYELEGIEWSDIYFRSNDDVLDLIFARPHGILALLDEESHFPQSSDATFVHKLAKYCSKNDRYLPSRRGQVAFSISHYAELVNYDAEGFLERNRDNLSADLMGCLRKSNNEFIRDLFTASLSATGTISESSSKSTSRPTLPSVWPAVIDAARLKINLSRQASLQIKRRGLSGDSTPSISGKSSPTVNKHLKRSLSDLMNKLAQAHPLFVRCLKPNKHLSPGKFDTDLVRRQLLCNGLMEIAQLRRDGYPIRVRYEDFAERYGQVCDRVDYDAKPIPRCLEILNAADIIDYKLGRTKVFLKTWHRDEMESCLKKKVQERENRRRSQASLLSLMSETTEPDYYHSTPHSLDSGNVSSETLNLSQDQYGKRFSVPNLDHHRLSLADLAKRRLTIANITQDLNNGFVDHRLFNIESPEQSMGSRRMSLVDTFDEDHHESVSMAGTLDNSGVEDTKEPPAYGDVDSGGKTPLSDDDQSLNTGVDVEQEDEGPEDDTWRPYDVFQISEREFDDNDSIFKEILKGIRLILYFFFVIAILAGTVSSRLSLFLIASGINGNDSKPRGESMVILLFCMCAPLVWNWLGAFMKILFGGKEWPSLKTLFVVFILEMLQTCGICLLVFRVLPSTDFFRGIIVTFAIFQVPSLLKVIFNQKKIKFRIWDFLAIFCALVAFLCQVGAISFFTMTDFTVDGTHTILKGRNSTFTTKSELKFTSVSWELPVSVVLVSVGWWENFVSGDWTVCGKMKISFKHWLSMLHEVRETSFFILCPVKIGLTVLLARVLTSNVFLLPSWSAEENSGTDKTIHHLTSYSLMYLQIGSGIICTYLAGLACKLHMQRTAFALPLLLSPPVSLLVVYLQCQYEFLPTNWHVGGWFCPNVEITFLFIPLGCAGALWISYCLIVSHVWFPESERMAKIEKLFITPHFDGVFPDFNLTMRRRRNDKELRRTRFDSFRGTEHGAMGDESEESFVTPMIYVCATMWHETRQEMTQLLKSLFRLDYMHCASRLAQEKFLIRDPDYFDLEIHIIFDDSFELDDNSGKFVPNSFVLQLLECMEDAARSVVKAPIVIPPPEKIPTPYGGRLAWTMPGQTKMIVHCKDKNKIRHRKRWSQCMYMYYLLGFRLLGGKNANSEEEVEDKEELVKDSRVRNRKKGKKQKKKKQKSIPLKTLLMRMPPEKYEKVLQKAESTFILCLDGDVDFRPDSVKLLIDRMKKNRKVGAVCGRIHPIGSGPMVWYQQFEYAIGHWLQKAAEHVFGCVLCCPGCFSLFRGSALMDDNVLKMYTTKPTEARHYIQFEQGEDRWLCTLLLQQGHRIDYCAGADALTFAPETFNEFFNQRRRWSPSTLANMMDLLSSWRETVRINDNISRPYILYQFVLMASTILAPSTVILMITGSYHSVLGIGVWWSYILSMAPVGLYIVICLTQKSNFQITAAAVLTALFTVVMMIATVGTIISIAQENFNSPNVVFLSGLVAIFFIAGLLHPQEFFCLVYGALYFLVVPSTFILLTVYYLCNLNNVSWGTREVKKKLTPEEEEEAQKAEEEKAKKKSRSFFSIIGLVSVVQELREAIKGLMGLKHEIKASANQNQEVDDSKPETNPEEESQQRRNSIKPFVEVPRQPVGWEPDPQNPYWLGIEDLGNGAVDNMDGDETEFWKFVIKKYLHPLDEDKTHKQKIQDDLILLRNNVVFIYFMLNFLWTVITLQLQTMEDQLKTFYIINKYEPLSLVFLSVFAIALALQFSSMFMHRWGTFLHLMSSTRIDWLKKTHTEEDFARFVVSETSRLQTLELEPNLEPDPDYGDDDGDYETMTSTVTDADAGDEMESLPEDYYETLHHWRNNTLRRLRSSGQEGNVPLLQAIFEQNLKNMQNMHKMKQGTVHYRPNRFHRNDSRRWPPRDYDMRQRLYQHLDPNSRDDPDRLTRVRVM